jgi:23S rRNA pseudouridine1911/1915/1917 synthase
MRGPRAEHTTSFRVREPQTLFAALEAMFSGRSRRDLRRLLRDERVRVNGDTVTDPERSVAPGDRVECARFGRAVALDPKVRLVHEDVDLLVVDKGIDILTSGGIAGRQLTVEEVLRRYLRRRGISRRAWPCHRLDRDVSGLVLFATNAKLAKLVRSEPRRYLPERAYFAVVEGVPAQPAGKIESALRDSADMVVRPAAPGEAGQHAVTHYRVLESHGGYAALEARLETGRKNQIRVHLAQIGHPIAGDRKYGARTDPAGRIALHAARLVAVQPANGNRLELHSLLPPQLRSWRSWGRRGDGSRH